LGEKGAVGGREPLVALTLPSPGGGDLRKVAATDVRSFVLRGDWHLTFEKTGCIIISKYFEIQSTRKRIDIELSKEM
jgi:hypothetical protein